MRIFLKFPALEREREKERERLTSTGFTRTTGCRWASHKSILGKLKWSTTVNHTSLFVIVTTVIVRDVDLFKFTFRFHRLDSFLLNISIRCFPHVIVLDDVPQTFPRQLVPRENE